MLALKPDAIINCAAYTQVDKAESEPEKCRAVNATAVEHLVRACGVLDCPLVQISTDYVFGGDACRSRGRGARTIRPRRKAFTPERNWKANRPPRGIRST